MPVPTNTIQLVTTLTDFGQQTPPVFPWDNISKFQGCQLNWEVEKISQKKADPLLLLEKEELFSFCCHELSKIINILYPVYS